MTTDRQTDQARTEGQPPPPAASAMPAAESGSVAALPEDALIILPARPVVL
jgi:hypothetical protein